MRRLITRCVLPLVLFTTQAYPEMAIAPPIPVGDTPLMQAVWDQVEPVASTIGEQSAVFYLHRRVGPELRAARVTSAGEIVDPFGIHIGETTSSFDVAEAGDHYLVAWARSKCQPAGAECVQLTRFEPSGEVAHVARIEGARSPRIAAGAESVLVVWTGWTAGGEQPALWGRLFTRELVPLGETFEIVRTTGFTSPPIAMPTSDGFLVLVSTEGEGLMAIPISGGGEKGDRRLVTEPPVLLLDAVSDQSRIAVLFRRDGELGMSLLDEEGHSLGSAGELPRMSSARLELDGDGFVVAGSQNDAIGEQTRLVLVPVTSEGDVGSTVLVGAAGQGARISAISRLSSRLLLVHERRVGDGWANPGGMNQYVMVLDSSGQPVGPAGALMVSAPVQRALDVHSLGETTLRVWEEYRDGIWQLYSQPADRNGQPLGWPIDHPHGHVFDLGSDGESFLLATNRVGFFEGEGLRPFIELTLLSATGEVELRRTVPGHAIAPRVAHDGQGWILLWKEFDVDSPGRLARLGEDLDVVQPVLAVGDHLLAESFEGGVYVLESIEGSRPHPGAPASRGLAVRVVDTAAMSTVAQNVVAEPSGAMPATSVLDETMASNGKELLVYWIQFEDDGSPHRRGYREMTLLVDRAGNILDEHQGLLKPGRGSAAGAMAWDGRHFVAAGVDDSGTALLVQSFDRRGAFREGTSITVSSYAHAPVAMTSSHPGQVIVDHTLFETSERVGVEIERIWSRTVIVETDRLRSIRRP